MFGPWTISTRHTRGGAANSKRWAILFMCLSVRAVHIGFIESMDTSSFINALRRFFAVRGPVKVIQSDCGTNFKGACKELQILLQDETNISKYLSEEGCTWLFTHPLHSSHMRACFDRDNNIACNKGRLQGLTGSLSTCRWRRRSFPEDLKHRAGITQLQLTWMSSAPWPSHLSSPSVWRDWSCPSSNQATLPP